MKRTLVFLMSLLVLGTISAQENKVKTYKIKSGYIKYKSLEKHTEGTHEIWWDNYGKNMREVYNTTKTTKFFGKKSVEKRHTVTITKGKYVWAADLEKQTGTQGVNPTYDFVQNNMGQMSESEQEQTANSILSSLGGKKEGKGEFMGYTCEITKMWGSKVWMYKGIALKSEGKMLGIKTGEEAVEFKPNIRVSASKFEPLPNIEYEKAPDLNEIFAEMEDEDEDEDDESEDLVPLTYPFEKFKAKMSKYQPQGYMKMGPMNIQKSMYTCAWMRGQNNMIGVSAMSTKSNKEFNLNEFSKTKGVETFRYNGHKCYYATPKQMEIYNQGMNQERAEESAPILIVIDEKYDTALMLTGKPDKSKAELLEILDTFGF